MTIKQITLLRLLALTFVLACGFIAGYAWPHRDEAREIVAYVEDCTLADAHTGKCSLPCSGDADCVAKNGTRDAY